MSYFTLVHAFFFAKSEICTFHSLSIELMQHLSNSPGPVFIIQNKFKESEMKPVQPIQKPDASSDVTLVSGDALVCKHFKFGFCKFGEKCHKQHLKETCQTKDCHVKTCNKRHPRICKYFTVNQLCKFGDTKLSTQHCNILEQISSLNATISSMSESIQALENEILMLKGSHPSPERKREDPAVETSISSPTATKPVTTVISVPHYDVNWHESPATALLSPGNGNEEPVFTEQALEVEVPSNYVPSPPVCSSCRGRREVTGRSPELTPSVHGIIFTSVVEIMPRFAHHLTLLNLLFLSGDLIFVSI